MDPSMNDADVAWLRSREPFAAMDPKSFPRTMPLEGILLNDCRLHRCQQGEIIVREGDYGNSAYLVLAGSVRVMVDSLPAEDLGRTEPEKLTWPESLRRFLFRSSIPEARDPHQITSNVEGSATSIRQLDDRSAIFLQDFDAILSRNESVSLGPGELFGEVAAMYRSPRTATVIAENEATLLEIRWQGLRVLRRDRGFADTLEQHYRQHWLPVHLREIPLLRHVPEVNLDKVAEATEMRSFGRMEWNADYKKTKQLPAAEQIQAEPLVVEEGSYPTDLLVVRSGFARMSRRYGAGHQTAAYLGKGHIFGLDEIAFNALRPEEAPSQSLRHSLRAVGFLDLLAIPVETFAQEVLPHVRRSELPDSVRKLMVEFTEKRKERRRGARREKTRDSDAGEKLSDAGTQFESKSLLEFIVQNRMNNGREAMVIDLHRCTRCDDCVKACASVHDGNPRFVRQGPQHERLQFVQACMHCSDPVCMIGCPTGSIARNIDTGVVSIHEPICVGCGTCAASCPYQNIRMAEVFDREGRPYCDASTGKPISKATKCDLCQTSPNGPACAAACPHDALVRIDLTESHPLNHWLERRS
tara:strand:+ start:22160 stop:23911 length:1752 start_codon:yes stop_codon:yes gene_type:complete